MRPWRCLCSKINFKLKRPAFLRDFVREDCLSLVRLAITQVTRLLVSVDVPYDIIGQSDDLIASTLSHLGESFRLSLVLKGVCGEINARSVDVGLDENVDTANTVQIDFFILVLSPVTHADQICTAGVVFFVTFGENGIGVERGAEATGLVGFDPGVVVD